MKRDRLSGSTEAAVYEISLEGKLDASWTGWFSGLTIVRQVSSDGRPMTTFTGTVADQAALRGLLARIWDLNLTVISVSRVEST